MDYRGLGFRECLAETARYLSIIEGLDSTDPLRVRLVSHLNNYASQREAHSGLSHLAWGSAFGSPPAHLTHPLLLQHQQGAPLAPLPRSATSSPQTPLSSTSTSSTSPSSSSSSSSTSVAETHVPGRRNSSATPHSDQGPILVPPTTVTPTTVLHPALVPSSASKLSPPLLSSLSAFPFPFSAFPIISPTTAISPPVPTSSVGKPYRPWGMEIGAFWLKWKPQHNLHRLNSLPSQAGLSRTRLYIFTAKKLLFFLWCWHPTENIPSYRMFISLLMYCVLYRRKQWGGRPQLKSNKNDLLCWLIFVPAHPLRSFPCCLSAYQEWLSQMVKQSLPVKFLGETAPLWSPLSWNTQCWCRGYRVREECERRARGGWESPPFHSILWGGITKTRCLFD